MRYYQGLCQLVDSMASKPVQGRVGQLWGLQIKLTGCFDVLYFKPQGNTDMMK